MSPEHPSSDETRASSQGYVVALTGGVVGGVVGLVIGAFAPFSDGLMGPLIDILLLVVIGSSLGCGVALDLREHEGVVATGLLAIPVALILAVSFWNPLLVLILTPVVSRWLALMLAPR